MPRVHILDLLKNHFPLPGVGVPNDIKEFYKVERSFKSKRTLPVAFLRQDESQNFDRKNGAAQPIDQFIWIGTIAKALPVVDLVPAFPLIERLADRYAVNV
jgi:hypothetical protein